MQAVIASMQDEAAVIASSRPIKAIISLPKDAAEEWVPKCDCDPCCVNNPDYGEGWFCPSRLSLSKLCWATGLPLSVPKGHTPDLKWFVYIHNFNYLYFSCNDRTWVVKRAAPGQPKEPFTLSMWQVLNAETADDIIALAPSSLQVGLSNDVEVYFDGEMARGEVCGLLLPSPVLRHCLGHFPIASVLVRGSSKLIRDAEKEAQGVMYVKHIFGLKDAKKTKKTKSKTYVAGYREAMSEKDPGEYVKDAERARVLISSVVAQEPRESEELSDEAQDVEEKARATAEEVDEFTSMLTSHRKDAWLDGLDSGKYERLNAWCYTTWIQEGPEGAKCKVCETQTNSDKHVLPGKKSQLVDHCYGKKHLRNLKTRICCIPNGSIFPDQEGGQIYGSRKSMEGARSSFRPSEDSDCADVVTASKSHLSPPPPPPRPPRFDAERRFDPEVGAFLTYAELLEMYSGRYSDVEIKLYWLHACAPDCGSVASWISPRL